MPGRRRIRRKRVAENSYLVPKAYLREMSGSLVSSTYAPKQSMTGLLTNTATSPFKPRSRLNPYKKQVIINGSESYR